ncbi:MAG: hypothetical protein ABIP51_17760 [Bacteroidia bacterium]
MQRQILFFLLVLFVAFIACKKDSAKPSSNTTNPPIISFVEYRNPFVGVYIGIYTDQHWTNSLGGQIDTTLNFTVTVSKDTSNDSLLNSSLISCPFKVNGNGKGSSRNCNYGNSTYSYPCWFKNDSIYLSNFNGNSGSGGYQRTFIGKKQ